MFLTTSVLICGLFVLCIYKYNIIRTLICIEVMVIAGLVNFCKSDLHMSVSILLVTVMIVNFISIILIFSVYTNLHNDNGFLYE